MSTHNQFPVLLNVDISETVDTYLITADVTRFSAESVKVTSWQDSLIVEMTTHHDPKQSYYMGELEAEYYRRVIPLGFDINEGDFYTKYTTGTLTIHVKKPTTQRLATADSSTMTATSA